MREKVKQDTGVIDQRDADLHVMFPRRFQTSRRDDPGIFK
jgi:hypothetical protein